MSWVDNPFLREEAETIIGGMASYMLQIAGEADLDDVIIRTDVTHVDLVWTDSVLITRLISLYLGQSSEFPSTCVIEAFAMAEYNPELGFPVSREPWYYPQPNAVNADDAKPIIDTLFQVATSWSTEDIQANPVRVYS